MPREDWPDNETGGYAKDRTAYCCRSCAEGNGCTCRPLDSGERTPTQDDLRDDPGSREFVQSLQRETKVVDEDDYGTPVTRQPPAPTSASND
jgi:hypothetical protein